MHVRSVKREELLDCEKIQSIAFDYSLDTAKFEQQIAQEPDPADPYLGFFNDDGILTACMELPEYSVCYEGHRVPMVGLAAVASLPEYRCGGAVRQLIFAAFRQMAERGAVFSALYPFSHPFYRKFGYELCSVTTEYELPLAALSKFRCTAKARMLQPGEGLEGLNLILDEYSRPYQLAARRDERRWRRVLGRDAYKERVYTYLLESKSGPSAYVVLAAEDNGPHKKICKVRETAFVHPQYLADVLGLIYRLSAQYDTVRLPLPGNVPLPSLLDESYDLKMHLDTQPMARVINVQRALELKGHFDGAQYTLCVRDEALPENDGVFSVHCVQGTVKVQKTEDTRSADLSLDVGTLSQLLLGSLSLDDVLYNSRILLRGNRETLNRVFVKHPVLLIDHF